MGNWEPAAQTERVRDGNPPPKVARAVLLLDCGTQELLAKTPPDQYAADLKLLLQRLRAKGVPVVWTQCLPLETKGVGRAAKIFIAGVDPTPYNEVAEKVLQEFRVPCVPVYQIAKSATEEALEVEVAPEVPGDPPQTNVDASIGARVWEAMTKAVAKAVIEVSKGDAR